jgi:excisionase family DNA binding protein
MSTTSNGAPGPWDSLWDANDVARYFKASRSWVYQQAEAGLLPSMRIGGLLRFNPEAVRAWAQAKPATVLPMRRGKP